MTNIQIYFGKFSYAVEAILIYFVLNILKIFPYRVRINTGRLIFRYFISPLTDNKKRIENNLNLVMPNLLEFFKKNEINMAIKIYNNKIKI